MADLTLSSTFEELIKKVNEGETPDLSGYVDKETSQTITGDKRFTGTVIFEGEKPSYITGTTEEQLVTESDIENFYEKPSIGIPKDDLESAVQTSLTNADNSVQAIKDINDDIDDIVDGTTKVSKSSTADSATNVTTNINGKAISTIFESNGTTVKKATSATSASTADKATSADDATNVTDTINGKAISAIFETDGTTVKKATSATSATSAGSATKATQDASGNVITTTYATKGENAQTLTDAKDYTDGKIADLAGSAPDLLNTLDELAQALGDDPNFATTVTNALANKAEKSTVYTKTEIDNKVTALNTAINEKADADSVYTISDTNSLLEDAKTEIQEAVADEYLEKTTYEWNREINFGSTGKLCIGRFPCYDTCITVEIKATTSTTYNATLILATQNMNPDREPSVFFARVYGDAADTITPSLYIVREDYSTNIVGVYFSPPGWSKNLVHIQCSALRGEPTDVCTNVAAIPTADEVHQLIQPSNALTSAFQAKGTYAVPTGTYSGMTVGNATHATTADSADTADEATYATTAGSATKATQDGNGANIASTYAKKTELATVATSGSYEDLSNKPTIPVPTNYYWANVKVASGSSKTTAPTFAPTFGVEVTSNQVVTPSATSGWSDPISKYLWHDLLAFRQATFEYSTDGETWTENTEESYTKSFTNQRENQTINIINDNMTYARLTWAGSTGEWHACQARWLVIGYTWTSTTAVCEVTFDAYLLDSTTGEYTWQNNLTTTLRGSASPYWFKVTEAWTQASKFRLTFRRVSTSGDTSLSAVKLLTNRWGNQGKGSEDEKPYGWDNTPSLLPKVSTSQLGASSSQWHAVYGKTIYESGVSLANKYQPKGNYATTNDLTSYALKSDLDNLATEENLANYATNSSVDSKIATAKQEILGEGVEDAYNTLVEIQELMKADDEQAADLISKVNANTSNISKNTSSISTLNSTVANKLGVNRTNGIYISEKTYIPTHAEGTGVVIPFIHNDLAFLTQKGGTYRAYKTTDTTFTASTLTEVAVTQTSAANLFDCSPSYSFFSETGEYTVVMELGLHKTFTYSNTFYIDFGASSWRTKNIAVLVMNSATETTYTQKLSVTNHSLPSYFGGLAHSSVNSSGTTVQGFNKMRIVLSGWATPSSTSGKRIAQIGLINYNSAGATEGFISRGGSTMYGTINTQHLYPRTTNTYALGSSSLQYNAVYGKTLYENGTSLDSKYVKPADLAAVATTGSYDDLEDKPTTFFYQATSSGSTAGTWLGTVDGITALYDGLTVSYKVPVAGASTTTLNINSLGAKVCYKNNAEKITTHYPVNSIIIFTYDSTLNSNAGGWRALADYDSTDMHNLRPYYARFYTGSQPLYSYKICAEDAQGRIIPLTLESGTGTSKTPNTLAFRPDRLYEYATTTTVNANSVITHAALYNAYASTHATYTFNSTITTYKEIYLKGTYNDATGLFTLNNAGTAGSTAWYVQVPYNTSYTASSYFASGYQYVYLGRSYSSSNYWYLAPNHEIYDFDGTNLSPRYLSKMTFSAMFSATNIWRGTNVYTGSPNFQADVDIADGKALIWGDKLKLTGSGSGLVDEATLTLPQETGTLATQEWVTDNAGSGGGGGVGESLEGQSVQPTSGSTVTAGTGAEIFNDYRDRVFPSYPWEAVSGNVASGNYSHAEGQGATASGNYSHAEGTETTASGNGSHAEGLSSKASGPAAHAEGNQARATGISAHAEGYATEASGMYSHAEGWSTTASGDYSHAGGCDTTAGEHQYVIGRYNKLYAGPTSITDTTGSLFIIGNGTAYNATTNAFRVSTTGTAYGLAAFQGSGADYAEMWEWADGNANNEDRRGLFVTVNADNKLEIAQPDEEYVLGVISATPVVVGDTQSEIWHEMYLKDIFGQKITETVEVEEYTDESGVVIPAHTEQRWKLNPLYNPEKEYIRREDRPEWSAVGLVGKLVTIDDGTCKAGSYCKVAKDGTATASTDRRDWRVLQRLDDTHVLILFR